MTRDSDRIRHRLLLRLLVRRVLPAEAAELAHLEPLGRLLLVLRRAVVAPLTLGARQRDDVSHGCILVGLGTRARDSDRLEPRVPSPEPLFDDLRDRAGADRAAAFADREARALFERDRRHQLAGDRRVVARHHHLDAFRQVQRAGDVGRPDVELRTVAVEERRVTAALFLRQDVDLALELRVRLDRAGLGQHLAALDVVFSTPRSSTPMLSPATPSSSSLRNISTPVTTFFSVGLKPTISISSPTLTLPRSTRPVTTVPRPEIENTSSIGIRNGLSTSRCGSGM